MSKVTSSGPNEIGALRDSRPPIAESSRTAVRTRRKTCFAVDPDRDPVEPPFTGQAPPQRFAGPRLLYLRFFSAPSGVNKIFEA